MKRQEVVQKLLNEFTPFSFKEEEKRELLQDTLEEYDPFLEKLPTTTHINVHLFIGDRLISSPYEIEITEGVKRFIHNMMELQNKIYVDPMYFQIMENALEDETKSRIIEFLSTLFNRRLEPILHGYKANDDEYFYYEFFEMNLLDGKSVEIIWQEMDKETIVLELIN